MDDTSSLPTTNIINLSYDRSKFFLVFFFLKNKNRSSREKTCKEVELMERTQQRIKLKQLKVIVCVTHSSEERKEGERKERDKEGRQKVRSRRGSLVESLKSSMKEEDNRVVVRIKTRINRGQKQGGRLFVFLTVSELFL
jgi:hypothetical protein